MLNVQNDDTCISEVSSAECDDFQTIDVLSSGEDCSVEPEEESEDDFQEQDDI